MQDMWKDLTENKENGPKRAKSWLYDLINTCPATRTGRRGGGDFHRHLCGWSAEQCHADRVAAISKVHNLTQKSIYIYLYSVKIESDDSFYSKWTFCSWIKCEWGEMGGCGGEKRSREVEEREGCGRIEAQSADKTRVSPEVGLLIVWLWFYSFNSPLEVLNKSFFSPPLCLSRTQKCRETEH